MSSHFSARTIESIARAMLSAEMSESTEGAIRQGASYRAESISVEESRASVHSATTAVVSLAAAAGGAVSSGLQAQRASPSRTTEGPIFVTATIRPRDQCGHADVSGG